MREINKEDIAEQMHYFFIRMIASCMMIRGKIKKQQLNSIINQLNTL